MKKITISILALLIILGLAISWKISKVNAPVVVACTEEAKICPDGSAVGRVGPKCEFSACPDIKESTTARLNQKILNGGVYITPLKVISDSRCPSDVQCIWAGEVVLSVKLEKGIQSSVVELKQGAKWGFDGQIVSLVTATPIPKSDTTISDSEYIFTFKVDGAGATEKGQGTVSGRVTLSPVCPVERIPPDPNCAPKGYATSIDIIKFGGSVKIQKTIKTNSDGTFSTSLDSGVYILKAQGGSVLPRCEDQSVEVFSSRTSSIQISCDSGIR